MARNKSEKERPFEHFAAESAGSAGGAAVPSASGEVRAGRSPRGSLVARPGPGPSPRQGDFNERLHFLLTPDEVADLLRTTRTAIYAMVERAQLPGVTRIGKRVLVRRDDLLQWLNQNRAPSPQE